MHTQAKSSQAKFQPKPSHSSSAKPSQAKPISKPGQAKPSQVPSQAIGASFTKTKMYARPGLHNLRSDRPCCFPSSWSGLCPRLVLVSYLHRLCLAFCTPWFLFRICIYLVCSYCFCLVCLVFLSVCECVCAPFSLGVLN